MSCATCHPKLPDVRRWEPQPHCESVRLCGPRTSDKWISLGTTPTRILPSAPPARPLSASNAESLRTKFDPHTLPKPARRATPN